MILSTRERHRNYAIAQGEERDLLTCKELFNDNFRARWRPGRGQKHVNRKFCLFNGPGDDDSLSRGKTISFDYNRRTTIADIRLRFFRVSKSSKITRWYAKFSAELLGVSLGSFELSRVSRRPATQYACVY